MVIRKTAALALILGLLVGGVGFTHSQTPKPRTFKAVVEANFDAWDANKDGKLDALEIDHLIKRHNIQGEEAAAVASIHIWLKNHPATKGMAKTDLITTKDGAKERTDTTQKMAHFNGDYQSFVQHLNAIPKKPFTDKKPQLEDLSQGNLGDCYFVSIVGALVHRNPESLHRLIHVNPSGDCEVTFPDGKKAHVAAFSDSLICLASTSRQSGIWLPVLEEAFGEVTHTKKKAPVPGQPAIDKIGAGGSQITSISLLTGRHAFDHSVKTLAPAKIHQLLSEAQARHYLMGASTPSGKDRKLPKGIASNHAYAVLSVQGDKIQVWNPWGNHFEPKGTPGLENGYPTEHGVFTVPLHDFCLIFSEITIETAEPAKQGKRR